MVKIIGPRDHYKGSYINTTSRSTNWSKGLSPFLLGPVNLYNGYIAKSVENAWQYCKVYPQHIDKNNNPTKEYFKWAISGWYSSYSNRYPMGKGNKPVYSFWNGQKLSYIDARKKIYIPLYAIAVSKSEAYQQLKDEYEKNQSIVLWDFDGYDYQELGMTLGQVINNQNKSLGHSFILAMLLMNKIQVINNQIKITKE